jgi:hypothetical protein
LLLPLLPSTLVLAMVMHLPNDRDVLVLILFSLFSSSPLLSLFFFSLF